MKRFSARRITRALAISFASALLLLLLAEGILRLCGYATLPGMYYDPEVGLRYYPNQHRHMLVGERDVGTHTTNEWGFRTPSFELEKAPGVTRIVCLGDSFTLGWGVDDAQTWPRKLQDLCDQRCGPGRVQVINLGQPDFNTVNEERLYRSFARRLQPDLVLLAYVQNDMAPETLGPINMASKFHRLVGSTAIMSFLRRHLLRKLGAYQFADNPENTSRRKEFFANVGAVLGDPDGELGRKYWDVSMQALRELAGHVREDGTRLLLVCFPDRDQVHRLHDGLDPDGRLEPEKVQLDSAPQQRIQRETTDLGVPMLDLLEDFSRTGPVLYGDLDGVHPAALGMQLTANRIEGWLEELGLVRPLQPR